MTLSWFFATTPAPSHAAPSQRRRVQPLTPWWQRLGSRFVAWGEQAHHHRLGSWTRH